MNLDQRTSERSIRLIEGDGAGPGGIEQRPLRLGAAAACARMVHARRAAA